MIPNHAHTKRHMKIGVDAGCLGVHGYGQKTGVFTAASNLLIHLTAIMPDDTFILYTMDPLSPALLSSFGKNVSVRALRPSFAWMSVRLSIEMFLHPVDLFLGFGQSLPIFCTGVSLAFIYDLAFERYPEAYGHIYKRLHRQTYRAVKQATHLIAISESTKYEIEHLYQMSPKKISVLPLGVDHHIYHPQKKKDRGPKSLQDKKYILFLGSLKPIKNISGLLKGYKIYTQSNTDPLPLVMAGAISLSDALLKDMIDELGISKYVHILGYVSEDEKVSLYQHACVFIGPSLWEGFGLPYIEAMACGCPVIGTKTGSGPEVIGESGILIDPHDDAMIAKSISLICGSHKEREKYVQMGIKRSSLFSWASSAKYLSNIIQKV